jgi:hypothetical protein
MEKETRNLMVTLSEQEINDRADEMAKCIIAQRPLISQRKRVNEEIKVLEERVEILADIINAGEEEQEVDCRWRYDWAANLRYLRRLDTGEDYLSEIIPPHKRQKDFFTDLPSNEEAKQEEGMFSGCPENEGGCPYFKIGNACAPQLCGKNLPPLQRVEAEWEKIVYPPVFCKHPESAHVVESNVTTCGICKTVIETAPITREMQPPEEPKKEKKSRGKKKALEALSDPDEAVRKEKAITFARENGKHLGDPCIFCGVAHDEVESGDCIGSFPPDEEERAEFPSLPESEFCDVQTAPGDQPFKFLVDSETVLPGFTGAKVIPIDKNRSCCMPGDRDILNEGDIRVMYCRVCGLITEKKDFGVMPAAMVAFTPGEVVDLENIRGSK